MKQDDEQYENEITPEEIRETRKRENDLKKANIKNVFGSGVGRVSMIVIIVVFGSLLTIGGYVIFSGGKKPQQVERADNAILQSPTGNVDAMVGSYEEEQMRKEANNRRADEAQQQGTSFLAPPVLRVDDGPAYAPAPNPNTVNPEAERKQMTTPEPAAPAPVDPQLKAELKALREQLKAQEILPQMLQAMGRGQQQVGISSSQYALPDRSKSEQVATAATAAAVSTGQLQTTAASLTAKTPVIRAGEGYYCKLRFGLNTDSAQKAALVDCYQGALNKSTLVGKFEPSPENANDSSVTVALTTLARPGKPSVPIQAIAIDLESESPSLADDVDHHTVKRYGGLALASLARGFGKAASIITGSTVSQSNGAQVIQTTQTDPIDGARQVKIAVGEVGTTLAESMQRRSDAIKTTIKVFGGKDVTVVFLADVFEQ